jgi:hypothetical protein
LHIPYEWDGGESSQIIRSRQRTETMPTRAGEGRLFPKLGDYA